MSVTSGKRSLRSGINDKLISGSAGHHVKAALRKSDRLVSGQLLRQFIEFSYSLLSQQPEGFLARLPSQELKVATGKQHRAGCKRIEHMLGTISARIEEATSIVVP